jgi:hypothetical protein
VNLKTEIEPQVLKWLGETCGTIDKNRIKGRYGTTSWHRQATDRSAAAHPEPIVQQAVRMILEPIWENDFADESIGYRPVTTRH